MTLDAALPRIKLFARCVHPSHNYVNHVVPVVHAANTLARIYPCQRDVVEAGAYMHDVGRVLLGGRKHHITGQYITNLVLYNVDKRTDVSQCVRYHQDARHAPTKEAEIVANADALAVLLTPLYLWGIHFSHKKDARHTTRWLMDKYDRDFREKLTLDHAKEIATQQYQHITHLLEVQQQWSACSL